MGQDRWVQSALANDNFVADLLIRLCEDQWSYPPPWMTNSSSTPQPLTWGVRRPRSKPVQPNLISPDSPMAFDASTSQSVGDGAPAPVHDAEGTRGSKAIGTTSATPAAATESSNRKTTAELKDKEVALQEENHLKRDIASALLSLEEHEPGNESLKKKKMEVTMQVAANGGVETAVNEEKDSKQTAEKLAASVPDNVILAPAVTDDNNPSSSNSGSEIQEEENNFVVPDLNVALDESQLQ